MPAEAVDRALRRADYRNGSAGQARRPLPDNLTIEPCPDLAPLGDVRGALRKLKHEKSFLCKVFEARCRQLYPRDLLVAYVPSKKGSPRAVGVVRRSQGFDKAANRATVSIDFVWVMPDFRSCGLGRALMAEAMVSGRPKDVHLQVAGSENNTTAVALYSSLGFVWDDAAPKFTEMVLRAEMVESAVAKARANAGARAAPACGVPDSAPCGKEREQQQHEGNATKGGDGVVALSAPVEATPTTFDVCDEEQDASAACRHAG